MVVELVHSYLLPSIMFLGRTRASTDWICLLIEISKNCTKSCYMLLKKQAHLVSSSRKHIRRTCYW